jgi:pimeloyl-ACP methyl ester carboxylesterase
MARATRHPGLHDAQGRELPGRIVEVGGCETYVVDSGSGPAVVLLHGWGDTADCWRRVIPQLLREHRVVALDIPPLGRSGAPLLTEGRDLIDFYGEFFPELFKRFELSRATVIGHSFGGTIALYMALEEPDAVERLVLVAPAGLGEGVPWSWHLIAGTHLRWTELLRLPNPLSRTAVRIGVRSFLKRRLFYDPRRLEEAVEHLVDLHGGRKELWRLLTTGRALMPGYTGTLLRRVARELECPVMMVSGANDGLIPVEHANAFATAVPRARVHVLDRCGHYPQVELGSRFNALVAEFLADGAVGVEERAVSRPRSTLARGRRSAAHPPP